MRTPITYYGSKQRMAPLIISMIPKHRIYCEPFFGGGAVFFQKKKAGLEVINDMNEDLISFYLCAQNRFEELDQLIQNSLCSESMYLYAKDIYNDRTPSDEISKAWAVWMITNGSYSGSMHGGWKWCNGTSGSNTGVFLRNKRRDFNKLLCERLEDVQISCRDALEVIINRDSEDTFFYLDPPYPGAVQGHYYGYTHTMLYDLLQVLSNIKGKFILSNYWCQTLRYHIGKYGWKFKDIEVSMRVNITNQRHLSETRNEILVYNFDIQKTLFD